MNDTELLVALNMITKGKPVANLEAKTVVALRILGLHPYTDKRCYTSENKGA